MNIESARKLVEDVLSKRKGKFSSLEKLFSEYKNELAEFVGLSNDNSIVEIIHNVRSNLFGCGSCEICGNSTKFYGDRGGWAKFCSMKCGNSSNSTRTVSSQNTIKETGATLANPEIRDRYNKTMMERYGVLSPLHSDIIREKIVNTNLERYGVEYAIESSVVREKCIKTIEKNYGNVGFGSKIILDKVIKTKHKNMFDTIVENNSEWEIQTDSDEWIGCHDEPILCKHLPCGHTDCFWVWFGAKVLNMKCQKCHGNMSQVQLKVVKLLEENYINFEINNRRLISPKEVDIYIPSRKLAIEINGLYFHSELSGKNSKYHCDKTDSLESIGIQLIHITDFDINNNWNAVSSMLLSKLGLLKRVYARKTTIQEITKYDADCFLNKYHMQKTCRSKFRYGLYIGDELVSVMTFGLSRYDKNAKYELLRFCSKYSVIGGASKILRKFREENSGSIVSYCDRRWSQGNLYSTLGFKFVSKTLPSYWYFERKVPKTISHRSMFQKKSLLKSGVYDESNTEWEIMQDMGYDRIWDCGTYKWIIDVDF